MYPSIFVCNLLIDNACVVSTISAVFRCARDFTERREHSQRKLSPTVRMFCCLYSTADSWISTTVWIVVHKPIRDPHMRFCRCLQPGSLRLAADLCRRQHAAATGETQLIHGQSVGRPYRVFLSCFTYDMSSL